MNLAASGEPFFFFFVPQAHSDQKINSHIRQHTHFFTTLVHTLHFHYCLISRLSLRYISLCLLFYISFVSANTQKKRRGEREKLQRNGQVFYSLMGRGRVKQMRCNALLGKIKAPANYTLAKNSKESPISKACGMALQASDESDIGFIAHIQILVLYVLNRSRTRSRKSILRSAMK